MRVHGAEVLAAAEHQGDGRRLDADPVRPAEIRERPVDVESRFPQVVKREPPPGRLEVMEERLDGAGLLFRQAAEPDGALDLSPGSREDAGPRGKAPAQGAVGPVRELVGGRLGQDGADEAGDRILPPPRPGRPSSAAEHAEDFPDEGAISIQGAFPAPGAAAPGLQGLPGLPGLPVGHLDHLPFSIGLQAAAGIKGEGQRGCQVHRDGKKFQASYEL